MAAWSTHFRIRDFGKRALIPEKLHMLIRVYFFLTCVFWNQCTNFHSSSCTACMCCPGKLPFSHMLCVKPSTLHQWIRHCKGQSYVTGVAYDRSLPRRGLLNLFRYFSLHFFDRVRASPWLHLPVCPQAVTNQGANQTTSETFSHRLRKGHGHAAERNAGICEGRGANQRTVYTQASGRLPYSTFYYSTYKIS